MVLMDEMKKKTGGGNIQEGEMYIECKFYFYTEISSNVGSLEQMTLLIRGEICPRMNKVIYSKVPALLLKLINIVIGNLFCELCIICRHE